MQAYSNKLLEFAIIGQLTVLCILF